MNKLDLRTISWEMDSNFSVDSSVSKNSSPGPSRVLAENIVEVESSNTVGIMYLCVRNRLSLT